MLESDGRDRAWPALDGLRGVSAIFVVIYHIVRHHPAWTSLQPLTKSAILAGADCVPIFFVLSGVVISHSVQLKQANTDNARLSFFIRRAFRIFPIWWALLIWMLVDGGISSEVAVANAFFYFGSLDLQSKWMPFVPAWTLVSELMFYLVVGTFISPLKESNARQIFALWVSSLVVSITWRIAGESILNLSWSQILFNPLSQASYFLAGIFLQKLPSRIFDLPAGLSRFSRLAVELFLLNCFIFSRSQPFYNIPMYLLAPALVYLTMCPRTILHQLLKKQTPRFLGQSAFVIYILQNQIQKHFIAYFNHDPLVLQTFFLVVILIFVSIAVHFAIEAPFIKLGKFLTALSDRR